MDPTSEKASYKEIHLELGVVEFCREERLWPTLQKGAHVRELSYLQKRPPKTIDWTHNRDAVESGCSGNANL